jgi:exonuclease SbcC
MAEERLMHVKRIEIKNILGIDDLTIEPGALTVISGRNAAGLIRRGTDEGLIQLELDDGVLLTKSIRPAKSTTVVRHPKLGKISKPAEWIKGIVDGLSLDPVEFLTAKAKERVSILLGALPIEVDEKDLLRVVPAAYRAGMKPECGVLEALDDVRGRIYADRRERNTEAREKRAVVSQMVGTLPEGPVAGPPESGVLSSERTWSDELDLLLERKDLTTRTIEARNQGITEDANEQIRHAEGECKELIEEARGEFERKQQSFRAELGEAMKLARQNEAAGHALVEADHGPDRDSINARIGEARARVEAEAKAEKTREMIETFTGQAQQIEAMAAELTGALGAIDEFKARLLSTIPIAGLEIEDGEIYVDRIPFDRLNDAERHRIAIEVAKLKVGDLGLILVDRAEIFDSKNWESFLRAAVESGLQIIAGKVSDGELAVDAIHDTGAAA